MSNLSVYICNGVYGKTYVVVNSMFLLDETAAHVETVKKDSRDVESRLWQLEQNADLVDEVDALGSSQPLLCRADAIENAGAAEDLVGCEEPLVSRRHGRSGC